MNVTLNLMLSLQTYIKCIIIVRHWMIYSTSKHWSYIGYAFIRYEMTVINIFQAMLHVKLIKRYGTSRKFLIDLFDNVMFIFELFFFSLYLWNIKLIGDVSAIVIQVVGLTLAVTRKKKPLLHSTMSSWLINQFNIQKKSPWIIIRCLVSLIKTKIRPSMLQAYFLLN